MYATGGGGAGEGAGHKRSSHLLLAPLPTGADHSGDGAALRPALRGGLRRGQRYVGSDRQYAKARHELRCQRPSDSQERQAQRPQAEGGGAGRGAGPFRRPVRDKPRRLRGSAFERGSGAGTEHPRRAGRPVYHLRKRNHRQRRNRRHRAVRESRKKYSLNLYGIRPPGEGEGDAPTIRSGPALSVPRPFPHSWICLREAAENEGGRREATPTVRSQKHEIPLGA